MILHHKLWGCKHFEFQVERFGFGCHILECSIKWTRRCDHAGLRCTLDILGLLIELTVYDCRHWDKDDWFKEDGVH